MELSSLQELFGEELKDIYDAEHQLVDALPKMVEAATTPELAQALSDHLGQTRQHVTRLENVFEICGLDPDRETCPAMKGLLKEGKHVMSENAAPSVKDAAIIGVGQRVEHYEIAAYGTLLAWAKELGLTEAEKLLHQTLLEEEEADQTLTRIAAEVNPEAASAMAAPRKR